MDIAIIGAGNVGRALATSFGRAGHAVTIASRDPEHAGTRRRRHRRPRRRLEPRSRREAADIVVLAIPFASAAEIAAEIRDGRRRQDRRRRHEPDVVRRRRPRDRHDDLER